MFVFSRVDPTKTLELGRHLHLSIAGVYLHKLYMDLNLYIGKDIWLVEYSVVTHII